MLRIFKRSFILFIMLNLFFVQKIIAKDIIGPALIGDISRGNHKESNLNECPIIVARPKESVYKINKNSEKIVFDDINGHWAEKSIVKFADKGYISNSPDNKFRPNDNITYAEIFTILANLNLKPVRFNGAFLAHKGSIVKVTSKNGDKRTYESSELAYFLDYYKTEKDSWFYDYLLIASEAGFFGSDIYYNAVSEYGENAMQKVYVKDEATRQYVALYLANMLDGNTNKLDDISISFSDKNLIDTSSNQIVLSAVNNMFKSGVLSGYSDNTFRPNQKITRAEFVTLVQNILDLYEDDKGLIHDNLYGNFYRVYWKEEEKLLNLTNNYRKKYALPELEFSQELTAIARIRAIDYSLNAYAWDGSHSSKTFNTPSKENLEYYFSYEKGAGENLCTGFANAEEALQAWLSSDNHRKNILNPQYSLFGASIGVNINVELFSQ